MTLLADRLEEYQKLRRSRNFSAETLQCQGNILKVFLRWLRKSYAVETADRLRVKHLHAYQQHLVNYCSSRGRHLRPGTINNRVKAVRGFLNFLIARSCVSAKLLTEIQYVKEPKLLPASVLTHCEVRKLLRKIDTTTAMGYRNRTILELLYSTGIRRGELLGLDISNVDLKNAILTVVGKGRKERVVPLGRTAKRCLESYLQAVRPFWPGATVTQALFLSKYGRALEGNGLKWIINACCAEAPVRVTPHTFRRSCTTELVRSNANLYHIKELLGHESIESLRPYTKLTINDLKKTHAKCHPRERDEKKERG